MKKVKKLLLHLQQLNAGVTRRKTVNHLKKNVRVTRRGIEIDGKYYWKEELAYLHGEQVQICYLEENKFVCISKYGVSITFQLTNSDSI